MSKKTPITVAHGDGIGPEIMGEALGILITDGLAPRCRASAYTAGLRKS